MDARRTTWGLAAALFTATASAGGDILLRTYEESGAGPFDPLTGKAAWVEERPSNEGGAARSCSGCHGTDLTRPGRHIVTGKPIEPLAVSANPSRLADTKKVEKWLRRNCRWTLGRECTPQEKGDFVLFIASQ